MKKITILAVFILVVLIFSFSVLANDKIVYWTVGENAQLDGILEEFKEENPGIEVETVYVPYNNAMTDLQTSFRANSGPDMFDIIQAWTPKLVASGYIIPLNEYIERDLNTEDYFPLTLEAFDRDGLIYAVPKRLGVEAVYYNKELIELGGFSEPPATWEEFNEWGKNLKEQGKYVYGITGLNPSDLAYRFLSWLYTAGGQVANDDWTEATINNKAGIAALEMETSLFKNKFAPPSGPSDGSGDVYRMFMGGQVATMIRGPIDMYAIFRDDEDFYNNNLLIGSMPSIEEGVNSKTTAYVYGLAMSSKTKSPESVWKLIKFMSKPENIAKLTDGDLPPTISAMDYPAQELKPGVSLSFDNEKYQAFMKHAETADALPNHPMWPEVSKVVWDEYQRILAGQLDVEEAANIMAEKINSILDEYNSMFIN